MQREFQMKITLINGNPNGGTRSFEEYVEEFIGILHTNGHTVDYYDLKKTDISYCIGCFGCWDKTPGECVINDDSRSIRKSYMNSQLVIFASPVIAGFTSALLKKLQDKLIPVLHPHFVYINKEVHHLARYDEYPLLGVLLENNPQTDDKDTNIITSIYERMAINLKTKVAFVKTTNISMERFVNEINSI